MLELFDTSNIFSLLQMMGVGTSIACALMVVTWFVARRLHNAGIVDAVWTASFTVLTVVYAILSDGDLFHRAIIASMVFIWSARLTTHLYRRVKKMHPEEDGRYAALRKEWGKDAQRNLFIFFQIQGVSVGLLTFPMAVICSSQRIDLNLIELLGIFVWFAGVVGETISDRQLSDFIKKPENKGKTMMLGLWNYSRHPNYFFEWLVWVGYFLLALPSTGGVYAIYVPLIMLHLLVNVSGVKLAEKHSLRSRPEEYSHYQKTTSALCTVV